LQERLVALGRPSGRDRKRVNGYSRQLIDASGSIQKAIASLAAKQLPGQVEREVALRLAKATVEHAEAMAAFAKVGALSSPNRDWLAGQYFDTTPDEAREGRRWQAARP
jgi:hypothetical protein